MDDCCYDCHCLNLPGDFTCCEYGYEPNYDSNECVDINECDNGTHTCCVNNNCCVNTPGNYYCCYEGYRVGNDGECSVDIDECSEGASTLPQALEVCGSWDCSNNDGGYDCENVSGGLKGK